MILKLQEGCWYAEGEGDPPRTCVEANAKQFDTLANAQAALDRAVEYRKHISRDPFPDAEVIGSSQVTNKLYAFTGLLNKTIDRFEALAKSKALGEELGGGSPLESAHEGVDELVSMYKQAIAKEQ